MGRIFPSELTGSALRYAVAASCCARRAGLAALLSLAALSQPAHAVTDQDAPPSAAAKYRHVVQSCATEATSYCSVDDRSSNMGRNQTYCLKQHRPDLSLTCRSAVNAALK